MSPELKMQLRKHTYPFKTDNRKKWADKQANGGKRPRDSSSGMSESWAAKASRPDAATDGGAAVAASAAALG